MKKTSENNELNNTNKFPDQAEEIYKLKEKIINLQKENQLLILENNKLKNLPSETSRTVKAYKHQVFFSINYKFQLYFLQRVSKILSYYN